jgi:N-acetylglucosamine kinase-like BadF-type ATPase
LTRLFLGLDGGQTATLAVLADQAGRLLGAGRAGPSNHLHEPGGRERLRSALHGSLAAAWENAGLASVPGVPYTLESAFCGMTGGGEQVEQVLRQVAAIAHLAVDYDLVTAQAGAFLGEPGVIVIGGTGSAAYGRNSGGQTARAGGWAYLMGDEGSAYDIGRQALVAAARVEDGRGPDSRLRDDLLAAFGKADLWEVRRLVYSDRFDRRQVAALAPRVSQAAAGGDVVAVGILESAGKSLAELAAAVLRRLGMDKEQADVAPIGGVFNAGDLVLGPFERFLKPAAPLARLVPPAIPPALGAALLALRLAGVPVDEAVKRNLVQAARRVNEK